MKLREIIIVLMLALAAAFPARNAAAQDSPYDDVPLDLRGNPDLINLGISLRRDPAMPPENFIIHITPSLNRRMTGCPPFRNLGFETVYNRHTLEIYLTGLAIDNTEFPYYKCAGKEQTPSVDVVLNRDDLIAKDIRKLKIFDDPVYQNLDIWIDERNVEIGRLCTDNEGRCANESSAKTTFEKDISAEIVRPQNLFGVKNSMRLWFYPPGTVLLYAPGSKAAPGQLKKEMAGFAAGMGLTPLEDIYPSFRSPLVRNEYYYYVDQNGALGETAAEGGQIGTMQAERMAYKLQGDMPVRESLPVFAKRPGAYD